LYCLSSGDNVWVQTSSRHANKISTPPLPVDFKCNNCLGDHWMNNSKKVFNTTTQSLPIERYIVLPPVVLLGEADMTLAVETKVDVIVAADRKDEGTVPWYSQGNPPRPNVHKTVCLIN
jgi:hypothetical protein